MIQADQFVSLCTPFSAVILFSEEYAVLFEPDKNWATSTLVKCRKVHLNDKSFQGGNAAYSATLAMRYSNPADGDASLRRAWCCAGRQSPKWGQKFDMIVALARDTQKEAPYSPTTFWKKSHQSL